MIGLALVCAVIVVRTVVLLDPATYRAALVEAEAYDRIYTEVLADPALADLKEDMLGDLGVPAELAPQVALARRQRDAMAGAAGVAAPARRVGHRRRPGLRPRRARRGWTLDVAVDGDRRAASPRRRSARCVRCWPAPPIGPWRRRPSCAPPLRELADQLAAGQVPATIPKLGGTTFDPEEVAAAILDGLGDRVDDDVRTMVLGAVLAGDERDAIIDGGRAGGRPTTPPRSPSACVADPSDRPRRAAVAARAEQPARRRRPAFDDVRDLARWTGPWTPSPACSLGGRRRGRPARARRLAAGAGLVDRRRVLVGRVRSSSAAGGSSRAAVASPLAVAGARPAPDGWGLPPATALLVADVPPRAVEARSPPIVWRCGAVLALVGVALVAGSAVARAVRDGDGAPLGLRRRGGRRARRGRAPSSASQPDEERACNGHAELCDRPYDDVTYAATHNSMSSPDVVPVWPEHDGGLTEQLDAGVRALLIDTHHWPPLESAQQLVDVGQTGRADAPAGAGRGAARPRRHGRATGDPARSSATSTARSAPSRSSRAWPR